MCHHMYIYLAHTALCYGHPKSVLGAKLSNVVWLQFAKFRIHVHVVLLMQLASVRQHMLFECVYVRLVQTLGLQGSHNYVSAMFY